MKENNFHVLRDVAKGGVAEKRGWLVRALTSEIGASGWREKRQIAGIKKPALRGFFYKADNKQAIKPVCWSVQSG